MNKQKIRYSLDCFSHFSIEHHPAENIFPQDFYVKCYMKSTYDRIENLKNMLTENKPNILLHTPSDVGYAKEIDVSLNFNGFCILMKDTSLVEVWYDVEFETDRGKLSEIGDIDSYFLFSTFSNIEIRSLGFSW